VSQRMSSLPCQTSAFISVLPSYEATKSNNERWLLLHSAKSLRRTSVRPR
jgi:hypothetical protein